MKYLRCCDDIIWSQQFKVILRRRNNDLEALAVKWEIVEIHIGSYFEVPDCFIEHFSCWKNLKIEKVVSIQT